MKELILVIAFLLFSSTAHATTIDQVNPFFNNTSLEASTNEAWQQEVTVGIEGYLVGIDLYWHINPRINNDKIDFFINVGSAWQTDSNDFNSVVTFTNQNNWNHIDVSSAGLNFQTGDQFVIGVQNTYDNTSLGGSYPDQYLAGDLFLDGQNFTDGNWDLAFQTYMEITDTPIPEPANDCTSWHRLSRTCRWSSKAKV